MSHVAGRLGINAETLRLWRRRAEVDAGKRPGVTTEEQAEIRRLKKENAELRRADEILKAASAFFAAELEPINDGWVGVAQLGVGGNRVPGGGLSPSESISGWDYQPAGLSPVAISARKTPSSRIRPIGILLAGAVIPIAPTSMPRMRIGTATQRTPSYVSSRSSA